MSDNKRNEPSPQPDDQRPAKVNILFAPDETSIEVPRGTTVLAAARKAGVFINSLCGGDGVCGRCRINVRQGKAAGLLVGAPGREQRSEAPERRGPFESSGGLVIARVDEERLFERLPQSLDVARSHCTITPMLP